VAPRSEPVETVLDLLVYAPLGLALEARDRALALAQKGRARMAGQEPAARLIGELVVREGRKRADQALKLLRQAPPGPRAGPGSERPAARRPPPPPPPPGAAAVPPARPAAGDGAPFARDAAVTSVAGPLDASPLAIPGYDTLSASQVVPRLEGLSADELEAIRAYELATRARKTVLTRITQLHGA
jgi:hypothetical protein